MNDEVLLIVKALGWVFSGGRAPSLSEMTGSLAVVSGPTGSLSAAPGRDGSALLCTPTAVGVMAFQAYVAELACGRATERVIPIPADRWDLPCRSAGLTGGWILPLFLLWAVVGPVFQAHAMGAVRCGLCLRKGQCP